MEYAWRIRADPPVLSEIAITPSSKKITLQSTQKPISLSPNPQPLIFCIPIPTARFQCSCSGQNAEGFIVFPRFSLLALLRSSILILASNSKRLRGI